jgi:hypothetical protein
MVCEIFPPQIGDLMVQKLLTAHENIGFQEKPQKFTPKKW